jgi:hypothetical protein
MKKFLPCFLLLVCFSGFGFTQTYEGYVFEIAARVKIHLPPTDLANLDAPPRYIQAGIEGYSKDAIDLVGYMDRYSINDHDMITQVETLPESGSISYFKFFLDPLFDANNFQQMLESFKITRFFMGTEEKQIGVFSNTIYTYLKSKK